MPKLPPFRLEAGLGDQAGGYRIEDLKVKLGESDLAGRLFTVAGDGNQVRIRIERL